MSGRYQKLESKKADTTNTLIPFIAGLIIIAVVIVVPIVAVPRQDTVPLPSLLAFEAPPGTGNEWQQRVCNACNNSWDFGTDERLVSNEIFAQNASIPDPRSLSSMVPFWGQVIDHDIVRSQSNASDGSFSIPMTPIESILLNTTRNAHRKVNGCRETVTEITPTIDASFLYGGFGQNALLAELRADSGTACRLRTSAGNLLLLHPTDPTSFLSGDVRNTEHSVLASFHTLFMREHNRLCSVLDTLRPSWTEEQKFWKARQVVVAKVQHITYAEWIPTFFGQEAHLLSSVSTQGTGVRMGMEFSVAAYRAGHSMIPDSVGDFMLPQLFFNRSLVIEHGIEPFLSGAYQQNAERMDKYVIDGLRNFLFMAPGMQMGEDLVTRNLFRNRELGMLSYTEIASCFGFTTQNNEQEAFIGLLSEELASQSSLPPGIARIMAEQFKRLRDNDPKFYLSNIHEIGAHFIAEITATSMATIIRANTELENVPDNVFVV
jgi:peroxidase